MKRRAVLVVFAVLIIIIFVGPCDHWSTDQKQKEPADRVHVIPIYEGGVMLAIRLGDGWSAQSVGEGKERGVVAVYRDPGHQLVILRQQAGDWTDEDAVDAHFDELEKDCGNELFGEPCYLSKGDYPAIEFSYTGYSLPQESGNENDQSRVPMIHVVRTFVVGEVILRFQASALLGPQELSSAKVSPRETLEQVEQRLRAMIEKVHVLPLEEPASEKPKELPVETNIDGQPSGPFRVVVILSSVNS